MIIEQRFPVKFKDVFNRYKYEINKSEDGNINWQNVIPSCKGYTHAIDMISDLIQDAQRQRVSNKLQQIQQIQQLDKLKLLVEKVISIRSNQINRNKSKNSQNDEEELIKKNHIYALKKWKNLLSKMKSVGIAKVESVGIAKVEESNKFLTLLILIAIIIIVIFGLYKEFSFSLILFVIILMVAIIGCIKNC